MLFQQEIHHFINNLESYIKTTATQQDEKSKASNIYSKHFDDETVTAELVDMDHLVQVHNQFLN
jgi:hypothetical protein